MTVLFLGFLLSLAFSNVFSQGFIVSYRKGAPIFSVSDFRSWLSTYKYGTKTFRTQLEQNPLFKSGPNDAEKDFEKSILMWREVWLTFGRLNSSPSRLKTEDSPIRKCFEKLGILIMEETMNGAFKEIVQSSGFFNVEDDVNFDIVNAELNQKALSLLKPHMPLSEAWFAQYGKTYTSYMNWQIHHPMEYASRDRLGSGLQQMWELQEKVQNTPKLETPMILIDKDCPFGDKVFTSKDAFTDSHPGHLRHLIQSRWTSPDRVPGVCPKTPITCLRLEILRGKASGTDVLDALNRSLRDDTIKVILHPFDIRGKNTHFLKQAYGRFDAYSKLVFASAGNDCNLDPRMPLTDNCFAPDGTPRKVGYPAAYKFSGEGADNILIVGAHSRFVPTESSAIVNKFVDIVAPGINIRLPYGQYQSDHHGTSYSAAIAAGVAQYISMYYPEASVTEIRKALVDMSYRPKGYTAYSKFGILDAFAALLEIKQIVEQRETEWKVNFPDYIVSTDAAAIEESPEAWLAKSREVTADEKNVVVSKLAQNSHYQLCKKLEQDRKYRYLMWAELLKEIVQVIFNQDASSLIKNVYPNLEILIAKESKDNRVQKLLKSLPRSRVEPHQTWMINMHDILYDAAGAQFNTPSGKNPKLRHSFQSDRDAGLSKREDTGQKMPLMKEMQASPAKNEPLGSSIILIHNDCPEGNNIYTAKDTNLPQRLRNLVRMTSIAANPEYDPDSDCASLTFRCFHLKQTYEKVTAVDLLRVFDEIHNFPGDSIILHPFDLRGMRSDYLLQAYRMFQLKSKLVFASQDNSWCHLEQNENDCFTQENEPKNIGFPAAFLIEEDIFSNVKLVDIDETEGVEETSQTQRLNFAVYYVKKTKLNKLRIIGDIASTGTSLAASLEAGIAQCLYKSLPIHSTDTIARILKASAGYQTSDFVRGLSSGWHVDPKTTQRSMKLLDIGSAFATTTVKKIREFKPAVPVNFQHLDHDMEQFATVPEGAGGFLTSLALAISSGLLQITAPMLKGWDAGYVFTTFSGAALDGLAFPGVVVDSASMIAPSFGYNKAGGTDYPAVVAL